MKIIASLTVLVVAGLAACASGPSTRVFGPVGPLVSSRPATGDTGFLKVYSAVTNQPAGPVRYFVHSSYTIGAPDGAVIKKVANAISPHDEEPELVQLPTGRYLLQAEADHYGLVKVAVVIAPGRLTTVNLQRRQWSSTPVPASSDSVRFPNGQVIGWRVAE